MSGLFVPLFSLGEEEKDKRSSFGGRQLVSAGWRRDLAKIVDIDRIRIFWYI